MVGIWPLIHKKTVEAIKSGVVDGVVLEDAVFTEASHYWENEKNLERWGLERAAETAAFIRDQKLAQGIYIVAPSRNPLLSAQILKNSGLLP